MTVASDSRHVESDQNEPDPRESGVLEDVTFSQAQRRENLGMLAGGLAHDLNNVLTVISSLTEFVVEEISAAQRNGCTHLKDAPSDMRKVLAAAKRATDLTSQFLSFDGQVAQAEVVDLNAMITGVVTLLQQTPGKYIQVVLDPKGEPRPTLANRALLEQALLKLARQGP